MKLYLSSNHLGRNRRSLTQLLNERARVGVVFNALDGLGDRRLEHADAEFAELSGLGISGEELDLRDYFARPELLGERLARYDLVFAVGGNAFVLARAMTAARFKAAAADRLSSGQLVYAGYSAGACVAGPDLDGCHLIDDPDLVPNDYPSDVAPETLALVAFRVVPHWRSEHPESADAECAYEHLHGAGLSFRALKDGQAIVIDGERERLV